MDLNRLFVAGLVGLSITTASSIFTSEPASAQGLRGRLREKLEGNNNNNQNGSSNQQNSNQQGMNGQQPVAGQPPAGAPGMPGQQYPGQAQQGGYDVSVVTLATQPGPGGSQMVVTPKGMVVPLPGQGVNGNAVQIFMGSQGGYWYTDKNGQQVDLTPAVHAMQEMNMHGGQAANVPQYAPAYGEQPQVVNNNYSQPAQSSGGSAMGTAAVAGMGAMAGSMAGAAISNSMYSNQYPYGHVPYGAAVHYGANNMPYYNQGGKPVYINNSSNSAEFNQINNQHVNAVQQQQDWYKKQQTAQGENVKSWQQQQQSGNNPFVRSEGQGGEAAAANKGEEEGRSGRFGRGESAQGESSGRRFGRGAGEGAANGAGGQAGGRLGNAANEQGGRRGGRGRLRGN